MCFLVSLFSVPSTDYFFDYTENIVREENRNLDIEKVTNSYTKYGVFLWVKSLYLVRIVIVMMN